MLDSDVNLTPNEARMKGGQISLFSLEQVNGVIYEEIKRELRSPNNKKIYKQMMNDASVETPYNLIQMMVSSPKWKCKAPKNAPEIEHTRAKMLSYMISTMKREWSEYIIEMATAIPYGFWLGEKIYSDIKTPHGDFQGVVNIQTISQDTVKDWHFDDRYGGQLGVRQDLTYINHQSYMKGSTRSYVDIPRAKYLHIRNSATRDNPEGRSVLNSLYVVWKYKALLEEYLTIGAIKDLGGVPIFEIYADTLRNAAEDPTGKDAKLVNQLKAMGQGLHAGDLQFGIVPVEYDQSGNKLFNFKLAGVEGGGKQIDILPIIQHYDNKILMRFFADVLSLGTNGGGSFALSDNKLTLLEYANNHHLGVIQKQLNHDLVRQIYKRNKWDYNPETACYFEPEKLSNTDLMTFAKAIQNMVAVGALPVGLELVNKILTKLDMETLDELPEDFEPANTTRGGEGLESGLPNGIGDSTSMGGDRSTDNLANGGS